MRVNPSLTTNYHAKSNPAIIGERSRNLLVIAFALIALDYPGKITTFFSHWLFLKSQIHLTLFH